MRKHVGLGAVALAVGVQGSARLMPPVLDMAWSRIFGTLPSLSTASKTGSMASVLAFEACRQRLNHGRQDEHELGGREEREVSVCILGDVPQSGVPQPYMITTSGSFAPGSAAASAGRVYTWSVSLVKFLEIISQRGGLLGRRHRRGSWGQRRTG